MAARLVRTVLVLVLACWLTALAEEMSEPPQVAQKELRKGM